MISPIVKHTTVCVIVPTFEENGILMLGVFFFHSVNFHRSKKYFSTTFFFSVKDINLLSSIVKIYLTSDYYF